MYKNKIRLLKNLQIVLIVVCLVALVAYFYFITKPTITAYSVADECGPIGGTISHPIDDEDSCTNVCRAYCLSLKKDYHDSKFTLNILECNDCKCFCKVAKTFI